MMSPLYCWRMLPVALIVAWGMTPQTASAQGSGLFGGTGLTKGGTGGISGSLGGSGFGLGSTGRGATGGTGMGMGMNGGMGGANPFAMGGTGMNGMNGMGATGFGGAGMNNSGLVGRNSGTFAGNARAGTATGNAGQAVRNFGNGGGGNNAMRNNLSQNTPPERTTSRIRPRQKVAFDYNAKSMDVIATGVSTRIEKIGRKHPSLKGLDINSNGGEIVVKGKVQTEDQARLAVNLLRLEPGVRSVRNEIEIEMPTGTE